jgi:hypothetical protein
MKKERRANDERTSTMATTNEAVKAASSPSIRFSPRENSHPGLEGRADRRHHTDSAWIGEQGATTRGGEP